MQASRDAIPGMGYPASVSTRPTKPSMSGPNLAISIAALVLTPMLGIAEMYRRRRAWPFAIATLALSFIAFFVGGVGYAVAVGA